MQKKAYEDLVAEVQELRAQLEEAQETLNAIRRGEVDGLVVSTPKGEQVYTISGAERPYRALIEDMREGAVMLSDDDTVLYCNSGFARMIKSSIEKILGLNIESMVCPTHLLALRKLLTLARAQKGAVTKEITLQANGDILVPTLMSINSLQSDTLNNTFLVVTDLTEHMEEEVKRYTNELELAQIALSESEQRWATTLASIGDAVIATDILGKIKFMNGVAEKLTGWILVEAAGRSVNEIFNIINEFSRKTVNDPVTKVLEKGTIVGLANHTLLVRKDKTEIAIDDSGAPIKSKDGKTTGVVLIFRDVTEQRKAEEALKKSERKFKSLADNAPDVIMRFNPDLRITYLNPKVKVATGIPAEQFLGKTNEEMGMPKDLVEMWNDMFRKSCESRQAEQREFAFPSPEGLKTYDLRVVPEYDEKDSLISFLGISRDITGRKKVEEALKESEEKYRHLVQFAPTGIYEIDFTGPRFISVNDVMCEMSGYTREELLAKNPFDLLAPESQIRFKQRISKALAGEKIAENVEYMVVPKGRQELWAILNVKLIGQNGRFCGAQVVAHDITQRKKAEDALRESESHIACLLELTDAIKFLSDSNAIESTASRLLGEHLKADRVGYFKIEGDDCVIENGYAPLAPHLSGRFPVSAFGKRLMSTYQKGQMVVMNNIAEEPLTPEERESYLRIQVQAQISIPLIKNGEFSGGMTVHSITPRVWTPREKWLLKETAERTWAAIERKKAELDLKRRTEELQNTQIKLEENAIQLEEYSSQMEELAEQRANQLKDAERLAAIGATAGMVGHDIRNPLQAITSDVYLAKLELGTIPESEEKKGVFESLQEIEKNTEYINKIVADLQDFARPLNPNAEETDIKLIIDQLITKIGFPENVKASVNVEDVARIFVADSTFINRIMYNLMNNAVQAMPNGGQLDICVCKKAKDIVINVKDTGVGIPDAVKGKLFTPMFTTKSKGQGFGLVVIKRMTESLGGTVSFESQEGKGTTFIVRFPQKKLNNN
jgi:PAS domain S-box-containing protein